MQTTLKKTETNNHYNAINYPFLLVTHMVCADQQIHSEESKALHELATQIEVGQRTLEEMEKILAQDDDQLSVEEIARRVPSSQKDEAMCQILAIAYVDGFCSVLEQKMAERIAQIWNWPKGEIQKQIEEAGAFSDTGFLEESNQQKLSVSARLLQKADSILSQALVNKLANLTGAEQKVEQLRREILLSGPEYDEAIRQCAVVAKEDYQFSELALKSAGSTLRSLGKNLQESIIEIKSKTNSKGQANTAQDVAKQLELTQKSLSAEIIKEIEDVRESLRSKERALNHFSIAFMGRTKAGKSTLHAIVTNDGWEAIGVGKQRTTRYNRVYEWKNIRIIDTPGIGAPDGKSDEEIAESVIEESDVICYVVTNDSIQATEFEFLHLLKKKAKPLIVLLNVKKNLRDPRRLEHFLKNPDKAFEMEGQSGLGGHIERIRRYAKEHYANDYFPIVPVMLLAAQLSREPEHENRKEELFKASRMQDFLDSIRESLIQYGTIRRSQTLLGSTVGAINTPYDWVAGQAQIYGQLAETIQSKQEEIRKKIEIAFKDSRSNLQIEIETIFQEAINAVPSFAEEHWNSNELGLKLGWEKTLNSLNFEQRLKSAFQEAGEHFKREVQEVLEEIGHELQLVAELGGGNFKFTQQDSWDIQHILRIGGIILGIAGTIIAFTNPIGIVVGIVAGVVGNFTGLFKSKDQKRREAAHKISEDLYEQLNTQKQETLEKARSEFLNSCASVIMNIESYFKELASGLESFSLTLEEAQKKFSGFTNYLNRFYAKRILDWSQEKYEPLTEEGARKTVAKVERKFGHKMTIITRSELTIKKSMDELKKVLQEDISIQSHKSVK
ncbi:GTPase [Capilliphycus salinus ALCB114379]|uniref:GTPase n=1 Tax=Capilliphycus salinus TaxID=2768948 RepID=UPI0039A50803